MNKYRNIFKWILHTKFGCMLGYYFKISGYNKVVPIIVRDGIQYKGLPSFNARTNQGAAMTAVLLSGYPSISGLTSVSYPAYIAISPNTLTPGAGDTTLSGESTGTGLARAPGTASSYIAPIALDGSASYVNTAVFTNSTGGTVTINSSASFGMESDLTPVGARSLSHTPCSQIATWSSNTGEPSTNRG